MAETSELSLESQAKLAELSVSFAEFFEKVDRLTNEVAGLKEEVSDLESRIRLIELEHAAD